MHMDEWKDKRLVKDNLRASIGTSNHCICNKILHIYCLYHIDASYKNYHVSLFYEGKHISQNCNEN